jgi:TRAP-type C4-dicarboxylate transport system permease small subunit
MQFEERIDKIAGFVDRPLWYACWVLLVGATLLAFAAVVMRYGFGLGYIWLDEICRYSFIALVYLWAGPIVRKGEHLRLEIVTARLKGKAKEIHTLVVNTLLFLTCLTIFFWGTKLISLSRMLGEQSESFVFYIWWLHALVALGMLLYAFYSFLEILKAGARLFHKGNPEAF